MHLQSLRRRLLQERRLFQLQENVFLLFLAISQICSELKVPLKESGMRTNFMSVFLLFLYMFSRNLSVPDFVRKTPGVHLFHLSGNTPESLLPDSSEFKVDPLLSDDNRYAIRDNSYLVVILLNNSFCLFQSFFHAVCRNHMQIFY